METQQNYKERANLVLKKALQKQPKLGEKIQKFYQNVSLKNQGQKKNVQQNKNFQLQIDQVHHMGSLSNEVYKVGLKNGNTIIVKHYFDILKQFIQRDIQHDILDIMTSKNQYPYVFYKDYYCRIQAYIPGSSISRQKLNLKLLKKITQTLAIFSKKYQHITNKRRQSKARQISNLFQTFKNIYKIKRQQNPSLVQKVTEYVQFVQKKQILENLQKLLKDRKMVMNHNDSNLSNILVLNSLQSDDPKIQLLDYEFSNLNYIGYDIGNMLNQIATDYGGAYEVDQTGKQHKFEIRKDWQIEQKIVQQITNQYFDILESNEKTSFQQRCKDVKIGRLLSHLYWLFIGLKQIDDPNIDLNMTYYIKRRHEEFMKLYDEMVS